MKRKSASRKSVRRSTAPVVHFETHWPEAQTVCLAGSFNQWNPSALAMTATGDGRWVAELPLEPGRYEYLFVVDGQWLPDTAAPEWVPNPFGGINSVIVVP